MEPYSRLRDLARWINLVRGMDDGEYMFDVEDRMNPKFKTYHNVRMSLLLVRGRDDIDEVCVLDGTYNSDEVLSRIIDNMAVMMIENTVGNGIQ